MSQARLNNLFQAHITRLQEKGNTALHALFESHAPGLDVKWEDLTADVKASIAGSAIAKRLGLDGQVSTRPSRRDQRDRRDYKRGHDRSPDDSMDDDEGQAYEYPSLRNEFETWQRRRFTAARSAFDTMLSENAFVEFWGRVGKMGLTDQDEKARLGKVVFADENAAGTGAMEVDEEEDGMEGEGGGGKRDLQTLAKGVDVKKVERVLKRDKRFIVFDYIPEEREQWLAVSNCHFRITLAKTFTELPWWPQCSKGVGSYWIVFMTASVLKYRVNTKLQQINEIRNTAGSKYSRTMNRITTNDSEQSPHSHTPPYPWTTFSPDDTWQSDTHHDY